MKPLIHLQSNSPIDNSDVVGSVNEAGSDVDGGDGGSKAKPGGTVSVTAMWVSSREISMIEPFNFCTKYILSTFCMVYVPFCIMCLFCIIHVPFVWYVDLFFVCVPFGIVCVPFF